MKCHQTSQSTDQINRRSERMKSPKTTKGLPHEINFMPELQREESTKLQLSQSSPLTVPVANAEQR